MQLMQRGRNRRLGWMCLALSVVGCGGDPDPIVGPEPAVAQFVGTWEADVFTVTNDADPTVVADLLIEGSFDINIQPSGLYTATLVFGGLTPFVEIGQLSVTGAFVTLRPNGPNPCPGSSEYVFSGANRFSLTGPTCFDFNLDGEDEDAEAHIELQRR